MENNIRIAPSILAANFARLEEEIQKVQKAGADWIHVDVMDGHFVPNITIGPPVVSAIHKLKALPLDVHLMISNPEKYIDDFIQAGASYVTIHQESTPHLHRAVHMIKDAGVKAGVALNPATPVSSIEDIVGSVDLVLVMSVNPGFGGQSFIPSTIQKCKLLSQIRHELGLRFLIEVDGGVNAKNSEDLQNAGVDVLVAGSAIFQSSNYKVAIEEIRNAPSKK